MDYLDFISAISERGQIKTFIESDAGVQATEAKLYGVFAAWWQLHAPSLGELQDIEGERDAARQQLSEFLSGLGYA